MSAVELATAYISLVPSLKGANASITESLAPEAAAAGLSSGERLGSGILSTVGKFAAPIAAALGIGEVLKTGFDEAKDAAAGTAQLAAGIQSTGNAANVTVDGLNSLAGQIQNYSGQTDDSIVKSEQLLLTFTNIKNNGPDKIFDDATRASADMAAKMGTDASASAIQLGKALNDPVKGISALSRVGVSFSDAQKKTIQSMVDTGNVAGAQKVILGELNKEFGGAAKAAGESFPGQLQRVHRAFEDLSQGIVQGFLPVMQPGLELVIKIMHGLADITGPAAQAVANGMTVIEGAVGAVFNLFKTGNFNGGIGKALGVEEDSKVVGAILGIRNAAINLFGQASLAYSHFIDGWKFGVDAIGTNQSRLAHWGAAAFGVFQAASVDFSKFITGFMNGANNTDASPFARWGSLVQGVFATVQQYVGRVWAAIKGIDFGSIFAAVKSAVAPIVQAFAGLLPVIGPLIPQIFQVVGAFNPMSLLFHALLPVLPQIAQLVGQLGSTLLTTLGGAAAQIIPMLAQLVGMLVTSLGQAFAQIMPVVASALQALMAAVVSLVPVVMQLVSAIVPLVMTLISQLVPVIVTLITALLPPLVQIFTMLIAAVVPLITAILPVVVQLFTQVIGAIQPLITMLLGLLIPAINALMPVVVMVFGVIANVISSVMQIVMGVIQVVTGIISGNWSMVWSGILNIFSGIWNTIVAVVSGVIGVVGSVISGGLNFVMGVVGSVLGAIGNWFSDTWNGIINGISGFIGQVLGFFSGLPGQIMGFLAGAGRWLFDAGKNIIQGLLDGIGSMMGAIGSAILSLVPGPIVGVFKAALGIQSPSRVFRALGKHIPEGIVLGLADGKDDVSASVRGLVEVPAALGSTSAVVRSSGATAGVAAAGGGLTINGNVYGNPEDIVTEMDARARRSQAVNQVRAIAVGAA